MNLVQLHEVFPGWDNVNGWIDPMTRDIVVSLRVSPMRLQSVIYEPWATLAPVKLKDRSGVRFHGRVIGAKWRRKTDQ